MDYALTMDYIKDMKSKSPSKFASLLALVLFGLTLSVISADYMNRKIKEIELGKPFYLKRTSAQWERQGRIIGELKNTPKSFTIDFCVPGTIPTRILKTQTFDVNLSVYESIWLGAGTYDLVFKSEGYVDMTLKNITIKPYSDCVINIVFGLTEYRR